MKKFLIALLLSMSLFTVPQISCAKPQTQVHETPLKITTTSLLAATELVAYTGTVTATGGTAPYKFRAENLPHGIVLSSAGVFSGIPTISGTFEVTLVVTDSERFPRSAFVKLSMVVNSNIAPVTIANTSLPAGTVNQPYGSVNTTLMAEGGVIPYSWAEVGTLPTGITFTTNGVFTGTPTQSGTFPITVAVADSETPPLTATAKYSLVINPAPVVIAPIAITTTSVPSGQVGQSYSQQFAATGGVSPYAWAISGTTPVGITMSTTGLLSGTPTTAGSYTFTVAVADSEATPKTSTESITLTIVPVITGSGATTPPICGIVSIADLVPAAASWAGFVPPAVGGSYADVTSAGNYCMATRVTNFVGNKTQAGCHYYATESPLDISDQYLMLYDCNSGGWFVDAGPTNSSPIGTVILSESATSGLWSHDSEPTWDRTTPGKFWATINNSIESCQITSGKVACTINHTFTEYAGYRISFMDETDMTPDGWLVTVGQNTQGGHIDVFLYNPVTTVKSPVYTTQCSADINSANNGCIHKLIATPNDGVVIQFEGSATPENGNELWESPWTALSLVESNAGGTGSSGSAGTDHFDTGKNTAGVEFGEFEDFQNNPGPWGACQDGWRPTSVQLPITSNPQCLFDNRINNPGWHVSWRSWPNSEFIVYSAQANASAAEAFNNASGYAAPSASNWNTYDNEVVLVLSGDNNAPGNIYRLALTHTRGKPGYFWSDPRAAEGYSGNYVVFDSNSAWGSTGCNGDGNNTCSDVYIIKIH